MSVRKRGSRWHVHVKMQVQGRTHEVRRASPVNSKRGAERFELQIRQALLDGSWDQQEAEAAGDVPTLAGFIDEYLAKASLVNKPATMESKRSMLDTHILKHLGKIRLDQVKTRDIDRFSAKMVEKLSPKTVDNMLTLLRNILATAHEWEMIDVVPKIHWLKVPKPEFRFLDFEEADRLVEASKAEPEWHAMVVLALNTGMRQGEMLALRWCDVDLKAGRLVVCRNVSRGVVGTPKNGRSREIPLNDKALDALRSHRHLRGDDVAPVSTGHVR